MEITKKAKRVRIVKEITFGQFVPPMNAPCSTKPPKAFVYRITYPDGFFYIGCKGMDKGHKWQTYTTSSKHLERVYRPTYEILEWCISAKQAKNHEQDLIRFHISNYKNLNYATDSRYHMSKLSQHKKQGIVK